MFGAQESWLLSSWLADSLLTISETQLDQPLPRFGKFSWNSCILAIRCNTCKNLLNNMRALQLMSTCVTLMRTCIRFCLCHAPEETRALYVPPCAMLGPVFHLDVVVHCTCKICTLGGSAVYCAFQTYCTPKTMDFNAVLSARTRTCWKCVHLNIRYRIRILSVLLFS